MLRAARAEGDPFRIVITDMQMPEMDGEIPGPAIKADPELRDTILVMMTSLGTPRRRQAARGHRLLRLPDQAGQAVAVVRLPGHGPRRAASRGTAPRRPPWSPATPSARPAGARCASCWPKTISPTSRWPWASWRKLGFRADAVANGREAIQALETAPYDLVLMDVQMPVMDGFEATRRHSRGQDDGPRSRRIPIIAMTAHAMKGDRERCLEAGMDDYISKPIAPQALAEALEKWLDRAQRKRAGSRRRDGSSRTGPASVVFDRQALLDRLMGDEDLVKEIIAGFLEDMPGADARAEGTHRPGRCGIGRRTRRTPSRARRPMWAAWPSAPPPVPWRRPAGPATWRRLPPSCPNWSGSSTCCGSACGRTMR